MWSKSSVADILKYPKYTGFQVYNRRARRSCGGVYNPPQMWVWSTEPAHEPLIPRWMFDEPTTRHQSKRGSRDGSGANTHPATRRVYALRGRVWCRCGRRMLGHGHRGHQYYRCRPKANNRGRLDRFPGHPATVYLREDVLLDAVSAVFNTCLFAEGRQHVLAAGLDQIASTAHEEQDRALERVRRGAAEVARKQANLLRQAEDADPNDSFTQGLRDRYNDLEAQRQALLAEAAELETVSEATNTAPSPADLDLVELLPYLAVNLTRAPLDLQTRLYQLTQLSVTVDHDTDHATIAIRIPGDNVTGLADAADALRALDGDSDGPPSGPLSVKISNGVVAERAPGAARSATTPQCRQPELSITADMRLQMNRRMSST